MTSKMTNPTTEDLLKILSDSLVFKSEEDKLQFEAEMISLDLVHLIQSAMEEKELSKSELAKQVNASKSYITQIFSAEKLLNLKLLAKVLRALNAKISFSLEFNSIDHSGLPLAEEYKSRFEEMRANMRVVRDDEEDYILSKTKLKKKVTSLAS